MTFKGSERVFCIGIGGSGMRGLAYLLAKEGLTISGTDTNFSDLASDADMNSYTLAPEDEAAVLIEQSDIVIYSDAVTSDHPLRILAQQLSKEVMSYAEALGIFASTFPTIIAVAGTHGKSSTTAMLAHIFTELGADPTVLIGASIPAWHGRNARAGDKQYFIVEADEYRGHFLQLHPTHAIITNVEFDHPDFFKNKEEVVTTFNLFRKSVRITVMEKPEHEVGIDLILPGEHMRYNAGLAVTMAVRVLGITPEQAIAALESFTGLSRRFELLGTLAGKEIYSDYGHHPTEIATTLKAAQEKFPHKKILVLFEAHTKERLQSLFDDFVHALSQASGIVLVPVFHPKGRELETSSDISEENLIEPLKGIPVWHVKDYESLEKTLEEVLPTYDVAIAFTAGYLDAKLRALL